MAALPTTGLSISSIATALGVESNSLSELLTNENVNSWGFNCVDINLQNAIWSKDAEGRAALSPSNQNYVPIPNVTPGYHLGYFRSYDHDWVTYYLGDTEMEASTYEENNLTFRVNIKPMVGLESKPAPNPAVEHTFKIEFARNIDDFSLGNATIINSSFIVTSPYSTFQIEPLNPPDYSDNGVLEESEHFYIRVTHISSPERRWAGASNEIITGFTTPGNTYAIDFRNFAAVAVKKTTAPATVLFTVEADLYVDFYSNKLRTFTGSVATNATFTENVFSISTDVNIPANSTPGTLVYLQHLSFDLSSSGIDQYVNVNDDTVFFKIEASTGESAQSVRFVTNIVP